MIKVIEGYKPNGQLKYRCTILNKRRVGLREWRGGVLYIDPVKDYRLI